MVPLRQIELGVFMTPSDSQDYCKCPEVLNAKIGQVIPCNKNGSRPIHSCGKEIKTTARIPSDSQLREAREIIENLIQYDAWRDNLHPNDFSTTRKIIADVLAKRDQIISELHKYSGELDAYKKIAMLESIVSAKDREIEELRVELSKLRAIL